MNINVNRSFCCCLAIVLHFLWPHTNMFLISYMFPFPQISSTSFPILILHADLASYSTEKIEAIWIDLLNFPSTTYLLVVEYRLVCFSSCQEQSSLRPSFMYHLLSAQEHPSNKFPLSSASSFSPFTTPSFQSCLS